MIGRRPLALVVLASALAAALGEVSSSSRQEAVRGAGGSGRRQTAGPIRTAACLLALPPGATDVSLLVRDVRVFDGTRTVARGAVLVRSGKIAAVGTDLKAPKEAMVIDGEGKTLLPGLIDCHTHVFGAPSLRQALVFGVTTELDMFSAHASSAAIKKQQAAGEARDLADLRTAGTLVTSAGGHGTEYGLPIPTIRAPEEAQAFVDARLAEGSDYIKIVYDDGTTFGRPWPTVSRATLDAVIAAAHKRGKLAVVHVSSLQAAHQAIEAGADGLAHLFVDRAPDAEFGRFVARHRAFVIPTLTVLEGISGTASGASLVSDIGLAPYLSPADTRQLGQSFPVRREPGPSYSHAVETVRQLRAAGVPILAGTDAPNPGTTHGASIHRELKLLVQAGLTPAEALTAATSAPAGRFRLSDRGRIAAGKRADLVLVEGDPTRDIKATRRIVQVWKAGIAADRRAYLAEVERLRAQAQQGAPVPAGLEPGMVSDFDEGRVAARFGAGWEVSTDSIAGGKSAAELKVAEGGAEGSKGSLLVEGTVAAGGQASWAGAIFYPGPMPMAPANLSSKKEVTFWAQGDGRSYSIMLFTQSKGFTPTIRSFTAGPEWKQFTFRFGQFDGSDGRDVMAIFIGAGPPVGKFTLRIDGVRLR